MFERCLYFNINALTRRINKIWDEAFASFDLSPSHAYLLRLVLAEPGLSQQELALHLGLEKSTITRFVVILEERKLLMREKVGRKQHVFPTPKSMKMARELEEEGQDLYKKMISLIGKKELIALVDELKKTKTTLD